MISYNGEVYNFEAIERDLCREGRRFATRCDTEAVLNAYLAWGPESVTRLRGMFAFAAADFERRQVLLARDRLGKKPLYYTVQNGVLSWSSELEPLYRAIGPFKLDLEALDSYLAWQYIPAPRTIYQEVRALPPGHFATIDLRNGQVHERRYWHVTFREDRSLSVEEWGERLDATLRDAVAVRFMSDVPFGAFLSGGIDSSLVVAYMAELMQEPVRTFTIGFKEKEWSEAHYAEQAAQIMRTNHHTEIVEPESLGLLPLLVRHYGQPFADSSSIPTYYVSKVASRHVKMVLSGDGGDESFAGYNSYEWVVGQMQQAKTNSPASPRAKNDWFRFVARRMYHRLRRLQRVALPQPLVDELYQLQSNTAHHFWPAERRKLFRDSLRHVVRDVDSERRRLLDLDGAPILTRLQYLDLMMYLPFDVLVKVDIAAMANSLEVRVPLLDHDVVELAATMPTEIKLKPLAQGVERKHILRQLTRRCYPEEFISRPKMGFGVPVGDWMADTLRQQTEERLLESPMLPRLFDMSYVAENWQRHLAQRDRTNHLWNLLFLDEWMRAHEDALSAL